MSDGRPTLGDVARAAGVHKATASRALNEATVARVHPATATRVRAAADLLGYRPNVYARGLRTRRSRTIGVVLPDIVNALFPPIVRGIEDALTSRGYSALMINTDLDVERERSAFDNLLARQVDGFIVGPSGPYNDLYHEIAATGTPVVVLFDVDGLEGVSGVECDWSGGVDAIVDLLVEDGHRRIAHLQGPDTVPDSSVRAAAFHRAFARHGITDDCRFVAARDLTARSGVEATSRILADHPEVTAIAAYNDVLAVGALRATFGAGLNCPGDISIVGFNDLPLVGDLTPALTTVRLPGQDMGYTAAQILLSTIAGSNGPLIVRSPVTLVRRESTGPAKDG